MCIPSHKEYHKANACRGARAAMRPVFCATTKTKGMGLHESDTINNGVENIRLEQILVVADAQASISR